MANKILVTDTLFIGPEHETALRQAGYEVERLEKFNPSEAELIEAVKDKAGYIIGGLEHVTQSVIDAAPDLKAIAFTGIGYKTFIPAWEYALQRGIKITYTPDGPTQEVAEWAVAATLMMNRHLLKLGRAGRVTFEVTQGIEAQRVGIIGLGRTGERITRMLQPFKPAELTYFSRSRHEDREQELGVNYLSLQDLLTRSDIVFLCVSRDAQGLLGSEQFQQMKQDALLVSFMHPGVIDNDALFAALQANKIRAVSDYPMDERFNQFDLDRWYCMNGTNTITVAGAKLMSDTATRSMINILAGGKDQYLVADNS